MNEKFDERTIYDDGRSGRSYRNRDIGDLVRRSVALLFFVLLGFTALGAKAEETFFTEKRVFCDTPKQMAMVAAPQWKSAASQINSKAGRGVCGTAIYTFEIVRKVKTVHKARPYTIYEVMVVAEKTRFGTRLISGLKQYTAVREMARA